MLMYATERDKKGVDRIHERKTPHRVCRLFSCYHTIQMLFPYLPWSPPQPLVFRDTKMLELFRDFVALSTLRGDRLRAKYVHNGPGYHPKDR